MTKTVEKGVSCALYVRLSRNDPKSMSIENQVAALQRYAPGCPVIIDKGVSGETNLTDPNSNWNKQVMPLVRKNPKIRIVVFTLDRFGRKKGAMMFTAETIIDGGGSIYTVREDRLFSDMDSALDGFELMLGSYTADNYRVETTKKTKVTLDVLTANNVPIGKKPELYDADIKRIKELRALGLGYESIGKMMSKRRKSDGALVKRSARLIKTVLAGDYESRDAYDRRNVEAREAMAARNVLARYEAREQSA
jgi:DNA invertase Pin-like site-specific DNA recombinase